MTTERTEVAPAEPTDAGGAPTTPPTPPASPPALSPLELGRWAWRQLTSMRTALVLLFLLALAAIPGSIIPQERVDAVAVNRWQDSHPTLTPVYEKLGLFSVYDSVWFSAIYILLVVSLVGCILPRTRIYWKALRARPPRTPRNLDRLPASRSFEVDEEPAAVLERAREVLRRRRYRVEAHDGSVAAERGYLREAGNLLFHVSVLVVLVGFALGQLYGFKGGVIVVNGQGFSNSLSQYDDFAPGSLFDPGDLSPFSFTVDDFHVKFARGGPEAGQPLSFDADLTYRETPADAPHRYNLRVNHPLELDGGSVYLVGHGYAPVVTVRDGDGKVAYEGPVVFLPQDSTFESFGVIKVPDAQPDQLGFEGLFLPTYGFTMARGPFSTFPDDLNPVLSMLPYHGDLGLDAGEPQSVYSLDKSDLKVFKKPDGSPYRLDMAVGQTKTLPNGAGSITFDGVDRWVKLQIGSQPGKGIALAGVLLAIVGLLGSLFIRPRRTWVRARRSGGRTVVEVAGLDRSAGGDLEDEVAELERLVRQDHQASTGTTGREQP
ncbi:MAG TPA: cytochrome c biogenesis protein ResB [Nocardioidaceae bacterium]